MTERAAVGRARPSGRRRWFLVTLAVVVLADYAAQVPYYFILYFPRPPSLLGTGLLAATLIWFLVGLVRYWQHRRWGRALLAGFLATEALFYGALILLGVLTGGRGGAAAQLTAHDPRLWTIFAIGYLDFLVALPGLALLARPAARGASGRPAP